MVYPINCQVQVPNIFGSEEVKITLYSGVTVFIGANGLGKTQTLKALKDYFRHSLGKKVRYLSSNRIGLMEEYRSQVHTYIANQENFSLGGLNEKNKRHIIETSTGDFFTLDEKKDVYIKVSERLSVLFGRNIYLKWDTGSLKVFFEQKKSQKEYSVTAEASGLVNIISILAALYDDEIEVLLIDEPEVSLHPQLQAYLLSEIKKTAEKLNKTIIISTHSENMIPFSSIKDISNLVFFSENNLPIQISPDTEELKSTKLREFIIRMGQIYKSGFFAKKLLFVEGTSDLIISKYLAQRLNMDIEAAGAQIIPIDGKGEYNSVLKLFRLIKKEVSVLTDLDSFCDDNSVLNLFNDLPKAKELASKCGCSSIIEMKNSIMNTFEQLLNKTDDKILFPLYNKHPYWINGEKADSKTKKRAIIGALFTGSNEELSTLFLNQEWKFLQQRLNTLFDILNKLGCFILKKGAIESYYQFAPKDTFDGKPSKAAEETSFLDGKDEKFIKEKYTDIINSLEYIALTKNVDEVNKVKNQLLGELPIILNNLKKCSDENDIYSLIKQEKGNTPSLFQYEINDNNNKSINVALNAKILEVKGFPFEIHEGENVIDKVNSILTS